MTRMMVSLAVLTALPWPAAAQEAPGPPSPHTDTFDDPKMPGVMETTVALAEVPFGTELTIVQQGIPDAIPLEACCLGWQESLDLLARPVEPEIREGGQ